ncbi:unnamed protein product [Kuraishia capsulata CBS 1993]|uniref:Sodium/calcium exchanger membrane region domain-containing protein n=1 Tax=Kuraishia capsulata CBS 1993 TaxID=1382522 RepID=W6MLN0_9ASCO|nr:uncharacterized protein KUCA_T00002990001 [Kuraishia capsulata CBS 1993]CDK27013.1 unnamed protein product [Kuraishia capsulata CBS 1993]
MLGKRHTQYVLVLFLTLTFVGTDAHEIARTTLGNPLDPESFISTGDGFASMDIDPDTCLIPRGLSSNFEACNFVRTHCDHENFRYAEFYYCIGQGHEDEQGSQGFYKAVRLATSAGYLGLVMVIFFVLGIVASHFLIPDLRHISRMANFDERTAGATLLSVGNGTPDLFATYAALESKSAALAIGELIGSATFVCTVVVGSMAIVRPFEVDSSGFTKDVAFFFVLLGVAFYFLHDGRLVIYECVCMIILYIFYVIFVILRKQDISQSTDVDREPLFSPIPHHLRPPLPRSLTPISPVSTISNSSRISANSELVFENNVLAVESANARLSLYDSLKLAMREGDDRRSRDDSKTTYADSERLLNYNSPLHGQSPVIPQIRVDAPTGLRIDTSMDPSIVNEEGYFDSIPDSGSYSGMILPEFAEIDFKTRPLESGLSLASIPFLLPLRLTVPVYPETDLEDDQDLRRLMVLFGFQAFFAPFIVCLGLENWPSTGWWNFAILGIAGILLSLIHIILSRSSFTRFKYSSLFRPICSGSGFGICLIWITILSSELIQILKNMGVIFRVDEGMLGLTVLALGNSVGDLIANTTLSSLGNPQTGISACFGTPLLYILLGVGLNGLIVIIGPKGSGTSLEFGLETNLYVSCAGLLMILMFYIVVIPRNKWVISREIGVFAICWWVLITTVNVILELRRGSTTVFHKV